MSKILTATYFTTYWCPFISDYDYSCEKGTDLLQREISRKGVELPLAMHTVNIATPTHTQTFMRVFVSGYTFQPKHHNLTLPYLYNKQGDAIVKEYISK
jgi:hypothetical protein